MCPPPLPGPYVCKGMALGTNPHICYAGGALETSAVHHTIIPPCRQKVRTTAGPDGYDTAYPPAGQKGRTHHGRPSGRAAAPDRAPLRHTRICRPECVGHSMPHGQVRKTARTHGAPYHPSPGYTQERTGRKYRMPPISTHHNAAPRIPKGGAGRRAAGARTPAICGTHRKQTAVCRSCGIVDNTPRLAAWCGDFAHISCRRPGNGQVPARGTGDRGNGGQHRGPTPMSGRREPTPGGSCTRAGGSTRYTYQSPATTRPPSRPSPAARTWRPPSSWKGRRGDRRHPSPPQRYGEDPPHMRAGRGLQLIPNI